MGACSRLTLTQPFVFPEKHGFIGANAATYRRDRLTAWEAELAPTFNRRKEALALVLKFNTGVYATRETQVAETMTRLKDPKFPRELLLIVIEATIESSTLYWKAEMSQTKPLADGVFVWPLNMDQNTRASFQHIVARIASEAFLVKIASTCLAQHATNVPPSLLGNTTYVRRLVVDLPVLPKDGSYHRELNRSIDGMASLRASFSNLSTCIFLLHVDMKCLESDRKGDMLEFRNIRGYNNSITLKKTFIWLVAAFLEYGPACRKLMRFSHSSERMGQGVGPLTELNAHSASSNVEAELQLDEAGNEKDPLTISAECVFEKAYMY